MGRVSACRPSRHATAFGRAISIQIRLRKSRNDRAKVRFLRFRGNTPIGVFPQFMPRMEDGLPA
jgi:hypothetical protein